MKIMASWSLLYHRLTWKGVRYGVYLPKLRRDLGRSLFKPMAYLSLAFLSQFFPVSSHFDPTF